MDACAEYAQKQQREINRLITPEVKKQMVCSWLLEYLREHLTTEAVLKNEKIFTHAELVYILTVIMWCLYMQKHFLQKESVP